MDLTQPSGRRRFLRSLQSVIRRLVSPLGSFISLFMLPFHLAHVCHGVLHKSH